MRGRVRTYNDELGYGWIATAAHGEVFVHYTAIQTRGYRALTPGDEVEFELDLNPRGTRAQAVVVVTPAPTDG